MDDHCNKTLLQQAIFDGICQKYGEELAENTENADCSKKHIAKMRKLLKLFRGGVANSKRHRRAWIAALLAAAVLLAGCSAYIFREEALDFVVMIYKNNILISYDKQENENNQTVKDIYSVGYMPEGYELKIDISNPGLVNRDWENADGSSIRFEQYSLTNSSIHLNGEDGETTVFEHGEREIYCRRYTDSRYYIWIDRPYYLMLSVQGNVPEEEILRIIDGIEIKTE